MSTTKAASRVVKQLAGSGTGQSLMDRVTQAKYSLAGSGLGKVVAKATTEEIGAPKKKHIDCLLVERTQAKCWVVVFKSLITTHNLMNFGNELLKALPILAAQLSVLLEFEIQEKDLNNAVINAGFLLMYKDLIRLFASYNEGMINLIEKYFTLKRKECRIGLDLYHAFPDLQIKITEFLTLAESLGIGDKDSLGLQPVPEKVIKAMEQHLAILESKKGSDDEADESTEGHTTRAATSKRPALPVPLPSTVKHASPSKPPPRSPQRVVDTSENTATAIAEPQVVMESDEALQSTEEHDDCVDLAETDSGITPGPPTVVVNDEEGLPTALQDEIIAAATSHFADTIEKSNEAVKRSAHQGTVGASHLGRSEQHNVAGHSGPPSRSHSPSASHSSTEQGGYLTAQTATIGASVSDGEIDTSDAEEEGGHKTGGVRRHLSALGLNEKPKDGGVSPICSSPFAGDEKDSEPATGAPSWPEASDTHGQSDFKAPFNTSKAAAPAAAPSQPSSALDDLLGLDLMCTDDTDVTTGISPTPIMPSQPSSTAAAAPQSQSAFGMDDLLSLDPLMGAADPNPPTPVAPPPTTQVTSDGFALPAGLKQCTSNVPIRPAAPVAKQSNNPLDALDFTLGNLASSLGGNQGWGPAKP